MGTLVETAIIDYRISFADQEKQTSVFPFPFAANKRKFVISILCLQQTNGSCRFLFAAGCSQRYGDMELKCWGILTFTKTNRTENRSPSDFP
jgi:hypothetical protein